MDYNLFISHSWRYSDAYDRLMKLLKDKTYFSFKDFSIPKDDPVHNAPNQDLLYQAIKKQITLSYVVIILAGVYASYSKWIENEIKIAKNEFEISKPILAIEPWGSEKSSEVAKISADKIVGWNTDSIVDAIRTLAK